MKSTATTRFPHPAYPALRRGAEAERDGLIRALAIEADWRYHDGPEWAGRYWQAFGDLAQTRTCDADEPRRVQAVVARRGWRALADADAARLRALFRGLLARLHPGVVPQAAHDARALLWPRVQMAYRDGNLANLAGLERELKPGEYPTALPLAAAELRIECARLRDAREAADRCLAELSQQFPFCLRDKLDDADWIARQRNAWRQALTIAAPERLKTLPRRAPAAGCKQVS